VEVLVPKMDLNTGDSLRIVENLTLVNILLLKTADELT